MFAAPSRIACAVGMMLLPLLSAAPVLADSAIYYSPSENGYGWCAGYSDSRAHSCARSYCDDWGGDDCSLAVECDGGWGAVALAGEPFTGIGAICGVNGAGFARYVALANCMVASRVLCWTSAAFDDDGDEISEADNLAFDLAWYAQVMLQLGKYDPGTADGELGSGTRSAIKAFQTNIGREATGDLDEELFWRLVDSVGGVQRFVRIIESEVLKKERPEFGDLMYGFSPSPANAVTFTGELLERPMEDRQTALATFLSTSGTKCTLPALRAEPADASTDTWEVDCVEGSYILLMSDESWIVVDNSAESPDPQTAPSTPSRQTLPLKLE
jgi:peptidoglycan hydrolase-like protein with peptidoglycan-binding domain